MEDIDTIINQTNNLNIKEQSYIYNRVSSKNQEEGLSLEKQSSFNHNYCIENNLNITDEIFEVASAWDKGYKQVKLIDLINNKNNCNIICVEPTRWSRSVKFSGEWFEILEKNNIILICTNPLLYSNNLRDKGIILLSVLDGENESKLKSIFISKNIKNRKRIGNYYPSIPKFGYSYFKISKNNIKLINNKNESLIKTLVHKLFYGGKVKDINQILFDITGDNKHFIYDEKFPDEKLKDIQHGNMRIIDVVNFLNFSEIKRRNKYWNSRSVNELL